MLIRALDPGYTQTAWCLFDTATKTVPQFGTDSNGKVLSALANVPAGFEQDVLAIEMIDMGGMVAGREVFDTCRWIGRFEQAARVPVSLVFRRDEKNVLCGGQQKARDSNIRQALIDLWGGESRAIGDVRCKPCKGKGWRGRDHAQCGACGGKGILFPKGPLHGIAADEWSALAIAVTYAVRNDKMTIVSGMRGVA